jgi:hypothetical protein
METDFPEKCCARCRYRFEAIGIGFGFRCRNPANDRDDGDFRKKPASLPPLVPSRYFLCPLFEAEQPLGG